MEMQPFVLFRKKILENCSRVIVGKDDIIEQIVVCLIASGHILLEDVPGTGKTMLLRAFAKCVGGNFRRIQFTPDLMPSDLTGINFYTSSATTSDPKNRTTVQHRPLTIPSTKAKKTTVKGPLIPEVEVDPEEIKEQPDPTMVADTTTVTFAGEAITDKDGTIIGFEDPQANRSDADRAATRAKIITAAAVGVVGLTSAAFVFLKLRRRP